MCTHRGGAATLGTSGNPTITATLASRDWTQGTAPNEADMLGIRSAARRGIATHTPAQNDQAIRNIEAQLAREENIARNYDTYVARGSITGPNDAWWTDHQRTLGYLRAQLAAFQRERKRQGR